MDDDKERSRPSGVVQPDSEAENPADPEPGERRRFVLVDTGFQGVPEKHRRFFREWKGDQHDRLEDNEQRCPRCGVVMRSYRELRAGDRLHCLPCDLRLRVERHGSTLRATVAP